ncbi:Trp biosynthesis-associated membrane protein [Rathayibacter toxicus]|uniref:Trp biosynthesis-associated membrane protein n=1 Tax=Rathayibacter toxicus TaxID=145458 RepID=UPI000CE7D947|nr:Trp biosynthesis-associated membrane protein [Rathayibacter toxicus]PPI55415.1 peptidase [Rathayibacter toxicus]QOD11252.1 Trp biosynthesis-associated membrane protein [Rathayibacter toxicus]QWL27995.1 peptidase [Rathayibacter toxicus]QWL30101.1 peptidase [Rathayibacter toxicus]
MSGRGLKYSAIVTTVLLAALELTAATQPWLMLTLVPTTGEGRQITVVGTVAAPALSALALATLALAAALALAGPGFRLVLGVLPVLLGGSVVLSAVTALANPVRAGSSLVTEATAISGEQSVAALVASVALTAWPVVALVGGVLIVAVGVWVLTTLRRWPRPTKKRVSRFEPVEGGDRRISTAQMEHREIDPVSSWDELSRGDDPTSAP